MRSIFVPFSKIEKSPELHDLHILQPKANTALVRLQHTLILDRTNKGATHARPINYEKEDKRQVTNSCWIPKTPWCVPCSRNLYGKCRVVEGFCFCGYLMNSASDVFDLLLFGVQFGVAKSKGSLCIITVNYYPHTLFGLQEFQLFCSLVMNYALVNDPR